MPRMCPGRRRSMWALPDTAKMRLLLDADVNVDTRSDERRTALAIAAGIVGAAPAVQLLLEYGASPFPAKAGDPNPLQIAARVGDADTFRLLLDYGADASSVASLFLRTNCLACAQQLGVAGDGRLARRPPPDGGLRPTLVERPRAAPVDVTAVTAATVRTAVERSLPLLQGIGDPFIAKTGCVSCHHNSVVSSAVTDRQAKRLPGRRTGGQRVAHADRRVPRVVAGAHAAEHQHRWRTGHDQLPAGRALGGRTRTGRCHGCSGSVAAAAAGSRWPLAVGDPSASD